MASFHFVRPQEAQKKVMDVNPIFWFGGPWPPNQPIPITQCPHPDKKGTNLLRFEFRIHLHTHQDLKLKCCRVMGQKLRYKRPCTHDLPGTHNWLAQSHIASISLEFRWISHVAQSCKFGVNCCFIALTHPAACGLHPNACTSDFWTCPQTPPL